MDYFDNRPNVTAPKSRTEIEAEKAAKPRPDLLPPLALGMAVNMLPGVFYGIAEFLKDRDTASLTLPLRRLLDEIVDRGIAVSRADALMKAGEIMGVGFRKHGPCTWRIAGTEQADPQTHYASFVRHLLEYEGGVTTDPDSGRHPLLHAVCQLAIMINLLDDPPEHPDDNDGRAMIGRPR